jgi:hypothetical protein
LLFVGHVVNALNDQKMKKLLLIIVPILCLVLFIGSVTVNYIYRISEAKNIVNVINQNASAAKDSMQIRYFKNGISHTNFLADQYVGELHKIDTSACPKSFQLSWLTYEQACELQAQQNPRGVTRANLGLMAIGAITRSSSLETLGTSGIERENRFALTRPDSQFQREWLSPWIAWIRPDGDGCGCPAAWRRR